MQTLITQIKELLLHILSYLAGLAKGREDVKYEITVQEKERLEAGLDVALNGDYSPDAVRERMRDTNPKN